MSAPVASETVAHDLSGQGLLVETLLGVAASLNASGDFDSLLANILHGARAVMRCAACSISLPDAATGELLIHSTQRDWKEHGPWRLPMGQGIAGKVFETRTPLNLADAARHPEHYRRTGTETGLAAQALLTIPILDGDQCRGVMQAMNPEDRTVFSDEDQRIFLAFGALVAVTLGRRQSEAESRDRAVREAERSMELELARQVQATFLPEARAEIGVLRIQAFLEQATGVGGDCYFYHAPAAHLLLAGVGDVTGKGLSAALDMTRLSTQIALQAGQATEENFVSWLVQLNNTLFDAMQAGDNAVALVVLLFDFRARQVHAATFAQHAPLCRAQNGAWREAPCPRNGFFGQRRLTRCAVARFPLAAGTHWVIHSDGITEAVTTSGAQFGRPSLTELLESHDWRAEVDVGRLVNDWNARLDDGARDDATLLLLEDRTSAPPMEFAADCSAESIRGARKFFEQWGGFAGVASDELTKLLVGCDEILTNILRHAYDAAPGPLRCSVEVEPECLRFIIRHRGAGLTQAQADALKDEPAREAGGLGLGLVRRVFTRVRFSVEGGESAIVLEKQLRADA